MFSISYQGKLLTPTLIQDYKVTCDVWSHICICYRKKKQRISAFLNCEEVVNFNNIVLNDDLGIKNDINFGNSNLDGEVTEIRIWSEEIPIKFIKENYRSPLPILAENKRKPKLNINKQIIGGGDAGSNQQQPPGGKKKFEFKAGNRNPIFKLIKFRIPIIFKSTNKTYYPFFHIGSSSSIRIPQPSYIK
jgi:hypothetical protein